MKKIEPVPYGSDVSSGHYMCADCGKIISAQSIVSLPPCPQINAKDNKIDHTEKGWYILTGQGDAKDDPYPDN